MQNRNKIAEIRKRPARSVSKFAKKLAMAVIEEAALETEPEECVGSNRQLEEEKNDNVPKQAARRKAEHGRREK